MHTVHVWAVLPAYNEEEALPPLLDQFAAQRERVPHLRVIVVDDGSQDGTAAAVRAFDAEWVQLVSHDVNQGLAQAMRTGFAAALAVAAEDDLVLTMDADNTHKPEQVPAMIDRVMAGADVVIASRFRPGAAMVGIPPHRRLFSWGVSTLFRLLTPVAGVRDFSCGYRLYRARTLQAAQRRWQDEFVTERGFACMTEILYKLHALADVTFDEVPLVLRYDLKPGPSKMPVMRNMRDMLALMWRHRWRPPALPVAADSRDAPSAARRET